MKQKAIITFFLISLSLILFVPIHSANASSIQPAQTPTATRAPEIIKLELEFNNLNNQVQDSLRDNRWLIESRVFQASVIFATIGLIAGFIGIKTYSEVDNKIKDRITKTLETELYRVDPTMKKISVPSSLPDVKNRLTLSHLLIVHSYEDLSKSNCHGITIVHINDQDQETGFLNFIAEYSNNLKPDKVAFILYATGHRIDEKTVNAFPNTAIANMPVTVVNAVLAVSRGLTV